MKMKKSELRSMIREMLHEELCSQSKSNLVEQDDLTRQTNNYINDAIIAELTRRSNEVDPGNLSIIAPYGTGILNTCEDQLRAIGMKGATINARLSLDEIQQHFSRMSSDLDVVIIDDTARISKVEIEKLYSFVKSICTGFVIFTNIVKPTVENDIDLKLAGCDISTTLNAYALKPYRELYNN